MHTRFWSSWLRRLLSICAAGVACTAMAYPDSAATLRAKYASLDKQLQQNQFKQPLVLDSAETPKGLKGDIYAIVKYPFGTVSAGLNNPDHWCDVLLHINTKLSFWKRWRSRTPKRFNFIGRYAFLRLMRQHLSQPHRS